MSSDVPVGTEAGAPRETKPPKADPAAEMSDAAALAAMADEVRQANERALRAQAEMENFRKRMRKDLDDQLRYAALPLLRDLLPVVDNLERALQAAEGTASSAGLFDGVKMVAGQLIAVLQQHQCRRIEAEGQPFDPNFHEAITQEPRADLPAGTVTRVTQMGYQLHDRVIRPSQVMVSTAAPAP